MKVWIEKPLHTEALGSNPRFIWPTVKMATDCGFKISTGICFNSNNKQECVLTPTLFINWLTYYWMKHT